MKIKSQFSPPPLNQLREKKVIVTLEDVLITSGAKKRPVTQMGTGASVENGVQFENLFQVRGMHIFTDRPHILARGLVIFSTPTPYFFCSQLSELTNILLISVFCRPLPLKNIYIEIKRCSRHQWSTMKQSFSQRSSATCLPNYRFPGWRPTGPTANLKILLTQSWKIITRLSGKPKRSNDSR